VSPQQTIAHYRITGKLGEGGMGEVWRATDTKLSRDVAIKILPEAFASDPDRLARFTREAQVLASLNHPNIAAIYGVEDRALVMELVDGATLAERLAQGPVPLEEALPIARQIAEALEYAHERGVIHRDLKPANIKITAEGRAKVLDFGLAKAMSGETASADPVNSPTLTMRATVAGVILGTAAYMAPEQAKGKPVDRRADIWAFGIVLLEMLTGKPVYSGETVSETLAAVIMKEPDLSALPAATPVAVHSLLRRCLDRDPRQRLRDVGEARIALEAAPSKAEPPSLPAPATVRRTGAPAWLAPILAASVLALGFFLWHATRPPDRPLMNFSVDLGPDAAPNNQFTAVISPDGRRLVYSARIAGGGTALATRLLDQSQANVLAGTENAILPFFKPDGEWIGFFADGRLKKISVQGGAPVTLCDAANPRGAWWGEDGAIVANLDILHIFRVPEAGGGLPQLIGKAEEHGDRTWRWPQILPGGQAVLVTAGASSGGGYESASINVVQLATGQPKILLRGGYFGRYLPSGHLVYVHQGSLFAVPFDVRRLEIRGTPVPVLHDVAAFAASGAGQLDFSQTGTLVYRSGKNGGDMSHLAWLDSAGKMQPLFSQSSVAYSPRLSPDGKLVAITLNDDISVYDPQRDATTRLTFRSEAANRFISWMPDGKHLIFGQATPSPDYAIWWARPNGSGQPEKLFSAAELLVPTSVAPDGRRIAFAREDRVTGMDLWTLPLDLSDPDHPKAGQPQPFLREAGQQWDAAFSPDGRWMAYSSSQTGTAQIFVSPFPAGPAAGRWQVSNTVSAARFPFWSRNGRELFYVSVLTNHIMVAGYTARGDTFAPEKPREWSSVPILMATNIPQLDLAPDGRRFVVFPGAVPESGEGKSTVHVTVLLNFFDELKRRLP
jgi:serine/threonine-protein kinase